MGTRRVGHSGTLDPQATGVLVLAVGPATRFLQYLPLEPKEYRGEITFGVETKTYDREGDIVREVTPGPNLRKDVDAKLEAFQGLIEQIPPMYSAVKMEGKPLYEYARKGVELERKPRRVHIDVFEVLELRDNVARVRIVCSGGTYVRSLAHDLGQAVGVGAHLSSLVRSQVGKFSLDEAAAPDQITSDNLIPLRQALKPMPMIQLNDGQVQYIRSGRPVRIKAPTTASVVALLDTDGEVFSVGQCTGQMVKPECVIPQGADLGV